MENSGWIYGWRMTWVTLRYSKSQVKRAGKTLRNATLRPMTVREDEVAEALEVLENWRASHSFPLNSAQMGLRSRMDTVGASGDVSQRLKRRPTIIGKLCRIPTMQLSTMQDIAGCRGVVPGIEDLYRVRDRWEETAEVREVYDYIAEPQTSGYRAVHVVVQYPGSESDIRYRVEVQLRTRLQHAWATAVEDYGGRLGQGLKFGRGNDVVLDYFRDVAEAMAYTDAGERPPDELTQRIAQRTPQIRATVESPGEGPSE